MEGQEGEEPLGALRQLHELVVEPQLEGAEEVHPDRGDGSVRHRGPCRWGGRCLHRGRSHHSVNGLARSNDGLVGPTVK